MRILAAASAALLIAAQLGSVAFAADASNRTARVERLMKKLERLTATPNGSAEPADAVTATRSAAFRIAGVINRKTPFTGRVRCEVSMVHLNADTLTIYEETLSEPATFSGNAGSCEVIVPFKWQFADVSSFVLIAATVYTDCSCTGNEIARSSTFELPVVGLPAEGTTRFMGFSIDM